MPVANRNLEVAAKLMARNKIGLMMYTLLYKARASRPAYGKLLGKKADEWRMNRMRGTFQKITKTSDDVEHRTRTLQIAMHNFRVNSCKQNKLKVNVAVKSLNKSLLSSHYQAKAGAAWALRAGFSAYSVAKSLNGLYLKKWPKWLKVLLWLTTGLPTMELKAVSAMVLIAAVKL